MEHELAIAANIKELKKNTKEIMGLCESLNLQADDRYMLEMVLNEALSNAIQYGTQSKQQTIQVKIEVIDKTFSVSIRDQGGRLFDPEYFENIALLKDWGKGGRGIFLMKDYMDEVHYMIYPNESTILFLSKRFN